MKIEDAFRSAQAKNVHSKNALQSIVSKKFLWVTGIAVFVLIIVGSSKHDASPLYDPLDQSESCSKIIQAAEAAMSARQSGVVYSTALRLAGSDPVLQNIVNNAWEQPRYHTETQRNRMISGFAWDYQQACLRNRNNFSHNSRCTHLGDIAEAVITERYARPLEYDIILVDAAHSRLGMERSYWMDITFRMSIVHDAFSHHYNEDPEEIEVIVLKFRNEYENACALAALGG